MLFGTESLNSTYSADNAVEDDCDLLRSYERGFVDIMTGGRRTKADTPVLVPCHLMRDGG